MRSNVWSGPDWRIECGDCLELLKTLPSGSVDAVVTDPPYGIGDRMSGGTWGAAKKYEDFRAWDKAPSTESLERIVSASPLCIMWGGNYFSLPPSRCWLVWDKRNAVPTMADVELAWTNLDRPAKRFSGNVGSHDHGHPSQKPLSLMLWCMQFVPPGATVLDPFAGSFTTGVACLQTGRKFIGFELDRKYCELGARRLADVAPLFRPPSEPQKGAGLFAREEA